MEAVPQCAVPGGGPWPAYMTPGVSLFSAAVQPRLIQGVRSGDGVGEDQETTA